MNGVLHYLWRAVDKLGGGAGRPGAGPAGRGGGQALLQAPAPWAAVQAETRHHRRAAQLQRCATRSPARRPSPHQPVLEQPHREPAPAHPTARAADAEVQVARRRRASCRPMRSSTATSGRGAISWRQPVTDMPAPRRSELGGTRAGPNERFDTLGRPAPSPSTLRIRLTWQLLPP